MKTENTHRIKLNYIKSGKQARRKQARREAAIGRQRSRLDDLFNAQKFEAASGREYPALNEAVA